MSISIGLLRSFPVVVSALLATNAQAATSVERLEFAVASAFERRAAVVGEIRILDLRSQR